MIKNFLIFLLLVSITVLQQSFFSLSDFYLNAQLPLVIFVFTVVLGSTSVSFVSAMAIGITLDWFSYLPMGSYLIIFILIWILSQFLLQKYLSNFSLFSVVLMTAIISIFKSALVFSFGHLVTFFNFRDAIPSFGINQLHQIIYSSIAACIIFFVINRFSKLMNYAFIRN